MQASFYSWGDVQPGPITNLQHAEAALGKRKGAMKKENWFGSFELYL